MMERRASWNDSVLEQLRKRSATFQHHTKQGCQCFPGFEQQSFTRRSGKQGVGESDEMLPRDIDMG
jgi:hypothetical protein